MYQLNPHTDGELKDVLNKTNILHSALKTWPGPLNIVLPNQVVHNYNNFQVLFEKLKITGEVYFAHKANQSTAIVRALAHTNCKIDVASKSELAHALAAGFSGNRIEATGPKDSAFIQLLLLHECLINVNSLSELRQVIRLKEIMNHQSTTPIMVRVDVGYNTSTRDSKFGISPHSVTEIFSLLKDRHGNIDFIGFAFHETSTSVSDKKKAIETIMMLTDKSLDAGLNPSKVNIGGSMNSNYVKSEENYKSFISSLKASQLDSQAPAVTWNRHGLGYRSESGTLKGGPQFAPFYQAVTGIEELKELLTSEITNQGTFQTFLQDRLLELIIEPGRSLLDQAGLTIAQITSLNYSAHGEQVLFLNINRSNLNAGELEFPSDPILLADSNRYSDEPVLGDRGVFLSGNLCTPHDFISRRKIFIPDKIYIGDYLVFANTAGYYMDFGESQSIQHPLVRKIAMTTSQCVLDEDFNPIVC